MRGRRVLLAVLAAGVLVPAVTSAGPQGFAPKWRVGDWWIVKSRMGSLAGHGQRQWQYDRYDVLSMDKIGGRRCYVLQQGMTESPGSGPRKLYYLRADDFRIVRKVEYFRQAGKLVGPCTSDFPEETAGPDPGELLPLFPLRSATAQDSAFRHYVKGGYLRQVSGPADSALLRNCLNDPDTSRGHSVQPRGGRMYSVLCESGTPRDSATVAYVYSLQLWSTDYPWRVYEEWGQYTPPGSSSRQSNCRSWLIAVGHTEK